MLAFNWKFLTPLSLSLLMVTAVLEKVFEGSDLRVAALLVGNLVVFIFSLLALRVVGRRQRSQRKRFKKRPVAKMPASGKAN